MIGSIKYHLTPVSSNVKTGPIPVSTQSKATCPSSCPFQKNGCYADGGPLNIHWQKITDGTRGVDFPEFIQQIEKLPKDQIWRYGQAGDLPGEGEEINQTELMALAKANGQRPVIVFTHKKSELDKIREAGKVGFQINLSANNLKEADELQKTGLPVVVVVDSEYERTSAKGEWTESLAEYKDRTCNLPKTTPDGNRLVICPATWRDTNCDKCRICSHERNGAIVGFPAHGNKKKSANEVAHGN